MKHFKTPLAKTASNYIRKLFHGRCFCKAALKPVPFVIVNQEYNGCDSPCYWIGVQQYGKRHVHRNNDLHPYNTQYANADTGYYHRYNGFAGAAHDTADNFYHNICEQKRHQGSDYLLADLKHIRVVRKQHENILSEQ